MGSQYLISFDKTLSSKYHLFKNMESTKCHPGKVHIIFSKTCCPDLALTPHEKFPIGLKVFQWN